MNKNDNKLALVMLISSLIFMGLFATTLIVYSWDAVGIVGRILIGIGVGALITWIGIRWSKKKNTKISQSTLAIGLCVIYAVLIASGYILGHKWLAVGLCLAVALTSLVWTIRFRSTIIAISCLIGGYTAVYFGLLKELIEYTFSIIMLVILCFEIINGISYIVHKVNRDKNIILIDSILSSIMCSIIASNIISNFRLESMEIATKQSLMPILVEPSIIGKLYIVLIVYCAINIIVNTLYLGRNLESKRHKVALIINTMLKVIIICAGVNAINDWIVGIAIAIIVAINIFERIYTGNDINAIIAAVILPLCGISSEIYVSALTIIDSIACFIYSMNYKKFSFSLIASILLAIASLIFSFSFYGSISDKLVMLIWQVIAVTAVIYMAFNIKYDSIKNQINAIILNKAYVISLLTLYSLIYRFYDKLEHTYNLSEASYTMYKSFDILVFMLIIIVSALVYKVYNRQIKESKPKSILWVDSVVELAISFMPVHIIYIIMTTFALTMNTKSVTADNVMSIVIYTMLLYMIIQEYKVYSNIFKQTSKGTKIVGAIRNGIILIITNFFITNLNTSSIENGEIIIKYIGTWINIAIALYTLAKEYRNIQLTGYIDYKFITIFIQSILTTVIWLISIDTIYISIGMLIIAMSTFASATMIMSKDKIHNKYIQAGDIDANK